MALPDDPFDLLEMGGIPFCTPDWENEFGRYSWIYLRGFADAMIQARRLAIEDAPVINVGLLKTYVVRAKSARQIGLYRTASPLLDWKEFAPKQIDSAHRAELMRFDKAWITLSCLDAAVSEYAPGFDIWDWVCPCPALFFIPEFTTDVLKQLKSSGTHLGQMTEAAHQEKPDVFTEMATGARTVTFRTAKATADFLNGKGLGTFTIRRVVGRNGWAPASNESVWALDEQRQPIVHSRKSLKKQK